MRSLANFCLALVLLLVLAACGDGSPTSAGGQITGIAEAIAEADNAFRSRAASSDHMNIAAESRCYAVMDPEGEILNIVKCGPVAYVDGAIGYDVYPAGVSPALEGEEPQFWVEGRYTATVESQTEGEQLYRPDGKTPPENLEIEIPTTTSSTTSTTTIPDAPPLEVGETRILESEPGVRFEPATTRIRLPGGDELRITEVARTNRVGTGPEALIAPEGGELVFLRTAYQGDSNYKHVLNYLFDGIVYDGSVQSGLHVVATDGSEEQLLRVRTNDHVTQYVDMSTWDIRKAPNVLYREHQVRPINHVDEGAVDLLNQRITYRFELVAAHLYLFDQELGWAVPGRAWLWIDGNGKAAARWDDADLSQSTATVELDDGTVLEPANAALNGSDFWWVFDVPDTESKFSIAVNPVVEATDLNIGAPDEVDSAALEPVVLDLDFGQAEHN